MDKPTTAPSGNAATEPAPAPERRAREYNEIDNVELRESIVSAALTKLRDGVDYTSLDTKRVEFGYLYDIEGRGVEALLRVFTDKATVPFAVQASKLFRLNPTFTDEHYDLTVEQFLAAR